MTRWLLLVTPLALGAVLPVRADEEAPNPRQQQVAALKKSALEQWRTILPQREPAHKETEHFLLFGSVSDGELEALGRAAERTFERCQKTLQIGPEEELWPGKMLIHVFRQRSEYGSFCRSHANRSPSKDEISSFTHDRTASYLLLAPLPVEARKAAWETELVQSLASAILVKKAGQKSAWFVNGFGRSIAYRLYPQHFSAERSRATALVRSGRTAWNVWKEELPPAEAAILQASFVDFLIHSPAMSKQFPRLLNQLGTDIPFDEVLKSMELTPEAVALAWTRWLPGAR